MKETSPGSWTRSHLSIHLANTSKHCLSLQKVRHLSLSQ